MAWQLHYTSAERGPTGRAGFQFVAQTPGLPAGARAAVTPHLAYRPPPDVPDDAALNRFPVAFLYDRVDGRPLLLCCRYLGRDYSGRHGNFFAHAVVAEPGELEGVRPAELWRAPLWASRPAGGDLLPELEELPPGEALEPEALAAWLGDRDAHTALGRLVDAALDVLDRGHGRLVLVSGDGEAIARWFALITYSLPMDLAARLTFTTYSADPDGAAQRLVGTTPGAWAAAHAASPDLPGLHLDGGLAVDGPPASLFGRVAADCWRGADLAALDALGELALVGPGEGGAEARERAAAVLALHRGLPVTPAERAAAALLLTRAGGAVPRWLRNGPAGPRVAAPVPGPAAARAGDSRAAVTGELLRLPLSDGDLASALAEVWAAPPTASECLAVLDAHPAECGAHPVLAALPTRAFGRMPLDGGDGVTDITALRLAARVRAVMPGCRSERNAAVVQAYADAVGADRPAPAAAALRALAGTDDASARLAERAFTGAVRGLGRRPPGFRAGLLAVLPPPLRARVGEHWVAGLRDTARTGRAALPGGAAAAERNALVEAVLRMRLRNARDPGLERWAGATASRWLPGRQLDRHLSGLPELRAELDALRAGPAARTGGR
ncbi:hypothetical protein [Spirillospora albida]|uniref:GAP1-N2 domain-containing protein n=1 Tax=Spirillospora albida TaxID=58123 RepID=UPI0004BEF093|nr:hypothetical protein [Spirillospora albida]